MGLEILKQAIDQGRALEPLTQDELLARKMADVAALKLVTQDVALAERYLNGKQLPQEWNKINDLYRAYVAPRPWPNSSQPRAHLGMPLIMEAGENMISQVFMAFFSDPQPFQLDPVGKTTPPAARAASKVLSWAIKQAGLKEEIRKLLKSVLLYGQGVGFWSWQNVAHETATYKKDGDGRVTKHPEVHDLSIPAFEFCELTHLLVDPSLRSHDIRKARWVARQLFVTADDLEELAENPDYKNIPTKEELVRVLAPTSSEPTDDSMGGIKYETIRPNQAERELTPASANPLLQPLEIIEYWTNDGVITVLQRKIIIRNSDNEFGRLPFVSCSLVDVLGAFHGFGLGRLLEGEQRFEQGVVNAWIDGLSLSLNPMYHRKKGVGAAAQNIQSSPGRVVNDDGDLSPLETKSNTQEAMTALSTSEERAMRRVGANFGQEMPNQAMRTAEGVNAFSQGIQVRLQYFIENFADMVFIPALEAFLQLCKDNLQPRDLATILTQEDGKDYDGDELDIYNGGFSIKVLSSTKLAARRGMAALIPTLSQMVMSEPVQNALMAQKKKFNFLEFVQQAVDLTGWPAVGLIEDATDEDFQRMQQLNPAFIQAQGKQAELNTKHGNDMQLEEEKATGRAGVQVVRHILDQSSQPEPAATAPLADALAGGAQPAMPPSPGGQVPSQQGATPQQV